MEVSPQELTFDAVSDENQNKDLTVVNPTDEVIVFKVKTTAPKTYCVKPNAFQAGPGETVTVQISRAAKAPSEASRDKFLVVSTPVSEELLAQNLDIHRLWEQIEKSNHTFNKEKIMVVLRDSSAEPAATGSPAPAEAPSSESIQRTPSVKSDKAKVEDQKSTNSASQTVPSAHDSKRSESSEHSEVSAETKSEEADGNTSSRSIKSTRGKISTFLSKKKSVLLDKSPRNRDRSSSRDSRSGVTAKDTSSAVAAPSAHDSNASSGELSPSAVAASKEAASKTQRPPSEAARVGPTIDSSKVRTAAEPAIAIHAAAPSGLAAQNPKVQTTGGTDPSTAGAAPVTVPAIKITEKEPQSKPAPAAPAAAPAPKSPTPKALPEKTAENTAPTHPVALREPSEPCEKKTVDMSDEVSRPGHIRAATSAHANRNSDVAPAGVPLQIVFYIALIAFLCGYLLF